MKILNVVNSIDTRGGGESERTWQMSRALAGAGHEVTILAGRKGLDREREESVTFARLVAVDLLNERFHVPRVKEGEIARLVAGADAVHLMGYWSVLNALVAREARRLGRPYVVSPAGSWRIFGRSKVIKVLFDRMIARRVIAGAAKVIAITEQERETFLAYGVAPERSAVIPNAIDAAQLESDAARPAPRENRGRPFILFLGRLAPIKGPDLLMDAYASSEAPRSHDLVFAGTDEGMRPALEERARSGGVLDRVRFLGHVSGAEKAGLLRDAAFLVIPSRHEAMSIVALEAGALGTPVLLTDQCGFDEVQSAGGGIVVRADSGALKQGLHAMLRADRSGMSENVRSLVLARYTWDAVARQFEALYRDLAQGGAPSMIRRQVRPI